MEQASGFNKIQAQSQANGHVTNEMIDSPRRHQRSSGCIRQDGGTEMTEKNAAATRTSAVNKVVSGKNLQAADIIISDSEAFKRISGGVGAPDSNTESEEKVTAGSGVALDNSESAVQYRLLNLDEGLAVSFLLALQQRQPLIGESELIRTASSQALSIQQQPQHQPTSAVPCSMSLSKKESHSWMSDKAIKSTFPVKLFRALLDAKSLGLTDVCSFMPSGASFRIHEPSRFMKDIAPRYFRQSQFSSFHRQLQLYGFSRIVEAKRVDCFHHIHFRESRPDLLPKIRRRPQAGRKRNGHGCVDQNI